VRAALDAGRAADAVAPLTAHLSETPTADGYTLLGVASLMLGRTADAERALTQALYLDPGHYDALVQLFALAQTRGDAAAAANYRRRAVKAQAAHAEGHR
jgi:chemotaxis protein methyltransferase WspC